jgi:hypothetical protein
MNSLQHLEFDTQFYALSNDTEIIKLGFVVVDLIVCRKRCAARRFFASLKNDGNEVGGHVQVVCLFQLNQPGELSEPILRIPCPSRNNEIIYNSQNFALTIARIAYGCPWHQSRGKRTSHDIANWYVLLAHILTSQF